MRRYSPILAAFLILVSLVLISCGKAEDRIEPLYATEDIKLRDAHVELWQSIGMTTVEPSLIRQVTRKFFGWIPVVGGLLELPLDLTSIVLPPLPSVSRPELPKDGEWNDPRLLKIIKGLKLGAGYIRITPIEERGPAYKPEKCWFFFECDDVGFDDFLNEVRVYLIFKDLKDMSLVLPKDKKERKKIEEPEVLLATADIDTSYDKATKTVYFNVSEENIRPYLDRYGEFSIKIIARGKYPKHKVYLDGKLRIDLDLKLSNDNP